MHIHVQSSTIHKSLKVEGTQVSSNRWLGKQDVETHTVLLSLKKKFCLTHATTWMKREDIMLSEISQTPKDKYI